MHVVYFTTAIFVWNHTCDFKLNSRKITRMISDQTALHSVELQYYLSLRLEWSLFKNKCKNKHNAQIKLSKVQTCMTDLASYSLRQWQFWQLTFKWLSGARTQGKNKQYYCCFLYVSFSSNYAIQRKSITWLVNFVLNCTWKPISHASLRDMCDIGFRMQFNAEFTSQVMNFPI